MTKDVSLKVFSKKININKGLYIIATPIGNISDITIRALKIFEKSDTIVCEDTRVSKRLFNLLGIEIRTKNWLIYNDHSQEKDIVVVMNELKKGKIVSLISDAGTPLISDPGYKLVNHIIKKNYNVYSIPGPCSAIASLALSGLRTDKFFFIGFLPKNKNDYVSILRNYSNLKCSLIIYEKPKRLNFLFEKIKENCKNFKIVVIKELTKVYEETIAVSSKNIEDYIKKKKNIKRRINCYS